MSKQREVQAKALRGSMQAVSRIEAQGEPKIGVDEFMSVCERFGFSKSALKRLRAVAKAENWGAGPFLANYYSGLKESKVQAFERAARDVFGVKYAIGVSSGTGALHAAFVAAGVGPGAEVICPAIGFFATASAVDLAGGRPVFCDVDLSMHMDPAKIEALVTKNTVAVAPTCVMGGVYNAKAITQVARKHKLMVVEDCAQSCGGKYHGRLLGTYGDLGCFSISAYKICGGGEGGLVLAKTKRLWERASQLAECGGLWRPDRFGPPRYPGELFPGTNYRMSELEAAVDVVQLRKIIQVVKRFRRVKMRVLRRLKRFREITPQWLNDADGQVGYLLRFYPESIAIGEKIVAGLQAQQIAATMRGRHGHPDWHIYHYMYPVTLKYGYARGLCPVADDLYDRVISIPLNQWYTARDCAEIAARINRTLASHCTPDESAPAWF